MIHQSVTPHEVGIPVWYHQLKPGDWFSFTPDLHSVWVKGNHAAAICLQTGTEADPTFASRQKCWLVAYEAVVRHRGKTLPPRTV